MKNRVYLEKLVAEDFEMYYSLVSNEKVMAMITGRAIPLDEARERYRAILKRNRLHEYLGSYKVIKAETKNIIGSAKLAIKDTNSPEAELGYMLLPEYWGKGYGNEIAGMLVNKAKNENQLSRLTAIIDPDNLASRKILVKNGFASEKVCEIDGLPGEVFSMMINSK